METKLYEKLDVTNNDIGIRLGILNQIVIGGFPLDIGTSLAFESIFKPVYEPYDPDRKIPNEINIEEYPIFLINIKTLFRNVFSSIKPDEARLVSASQFAYFIEFEINVIRNLLINEGQNKSNPVFYICNYTKLYSTSFPAGVRLRMPDTEKQLVQNTLMVRTMDILLKNKDLGIIKFTNTINTGDNVKALILTHIPYDLFANTYFKQLDLIESYTGILKTKINWPSKYYHGKDYSNIPFNIKLIKMLGDNEMFHPLPIRYRNEIKELANNRNWSPLTTRDSVAYDILHFLKNEELLNIYKGLKYE